MRTDKQVTLGFSVLVCLAFLEAPQRLCQAQRKPIHLTSLCSCARTGTSPGQGLPRAGTLTKNGEGRAAPLQPGSPLLASLCRARVLGAGGARALTAFSLPPTPHHCTSSVLQDQGQARPCCWFWESPGRRDLISQYEQQFTPQFWTGSH